MKTALLQASQPDELQQAVALLRSGALVAVPTETVYGLAADIASPEAVRRIFSAKQRPPGHPLIVHIHANSELERWAAAVPPAAWRLAEAFWPGPLTLLLQKSAAVPDVVTGGLPTVGLRRPDHPVLAALLQQLGSAVAAPSANLHKQLSPTTAAQVLSSLDGRIDAVLDGGPCSVGLESTIVDLSGPLPRILRSGPITREQLEAVLQTPVEQPQRHDTVVPGNMAEHYRPHAPLYSVPRAALAATLQQLGAARCALALHGEPPAELAAQLAVQQVLALRSLPQDKAGYARELYGALYELDRLQPACIVLETPPQDAAWLDVNDRLARATSPLPF
jgi:L-threonylcarbamoyladenylate synthase